jgi:hypothetical protein
MKCEQIQSLVMDFLYDEISEEDREIFIAHLSQCESCQKELESLKNTSHFLQQWEDIDPDFNVVMVTKKVSWLSLIKERWVQLLPKPKQIVYGLAYVAVGIFLILAIANTEISYRQGEFKMSMGLFSRPSSQEKADNLLNQEFVEQLHQENYYLMNSLIDQSEARQRKEMAATILRLRQDFERQRVEDLNLVGFGLDNVERNTYRQIKRTDNSLNELIQLISTQKK